MEVHYKCTTWCKIKFESEKVDKAELIELLSKHEPNDVLFNQMDVNAEWESINETEEFLSVEENQGNPTVELMEITDNGFLKCSWHNGN